MSRNDTSETLPWMRAGTEHLLAVVEGIPDAELTASSALPGWTRAHVVAHLARNAEALVRLATWARTGVETPMYPSPEARAAEIEETSGRAPEVLRSELASTARELDEALGALSPEQWEATIRSAQGREIPATEIPFLRIREVWIHAADLGTGASLADLPAGVVDLLLDDVTATLSGRKGCPTLLLAPTDRERVWQLGDPGVTPAPVVSGPGESIPAESAPLGEMETTKAPALDIVAWLTGRAPASVLPGTPPELPRWL
ncbi:maleylpyruvate isomerase family mycothiol-dependent enzyme [Pseudonocardia halophobica]|uniref:maleylpyruvate isomerase family mycothiol-dependent enzyme n=1 Tax=Pseudonocardia halophobica TaxID=29401 RepID=UPI003D8D06F0